MRTKLKNRVFGLILAAILVIVTGCAQLGGPDSADVAGNGLETTHIKVATTVVVDVGPLLLAQKKGYFAKEGLTVDVVAAQNPSISLTKAISGDTDFCATTYTQMMIAKAGGTDLKIIADAASAKPRSNAIVTVPNSPVKTIRDLAGKKIGVSSLNASSHVLTTSLMHDNNVPTDKVQWAYVAFPNMAALLKSGELDAAYLPEPFLTQAAQIAGATPIIDVSTSATDDFPLLGYAGSNAWVQGHPKTMAAFQRAMRDATRDADMHREWIEPLIAEFAKVDADVVKMLALPNLHSIVAVNRIERVPDLMLRLGFLKQLVDVAPMIVKQAD